MSKIRFEVKVTVFYLFIGLLWILFSDRIIYALISDPEKLTFAQTYKGGFFILVTAILLFFILQDFHKKLRRSESKAAETENLKMAFVKNISHEIRTPLNGISGFSQLLHEPSLTLNEKIEYIDIIEKSSQELLLAVDGMMDLSLLESSGAYFHNISFDVVSMMENVYHHYKMYETKSVNIIMDCNIEEGLRIIHTDQSKIKMAFSHMINNAFKYTTKGYIKMGCYYDKGSLVFYVKDTGIGINTKNQQKLTELFGKIKENRVEFKTGVALGLCISKSIIMHLGGQIWLSSEEGEGSTFFFSFPYHILKPRKPLFSITNN